MSIRFGLFGTGYWADKCHAPGLAAHPDIELVGIWGRDAAKAEALARRHGTTAEIDSDALIARVDAVAIALSPEAQPDLACRAAEAGCHLLLEKPLSFSTAEADRVVEACDRGRVASLVFFTPRFVDVVATWLRDIVAAEWVGGHATLIADVLAPGSPFAGSAWRREMGALWDAGPHVLSVLLPVLGAVDEVVAVRGLDDTVNLGFSHSKGATSCATLSLTAPAAASRFALELWRMSRTVWNFGGGPGVM